MLIVYVMVVALLMAGASQAGELKPKFGDIGGVYYTDVSGNREACRQAIRNKIALCRENTNFESNTKNRKYPGCLPVFRQQTQSCITHFRHQMSKCDLDGSARITDFTGFGCTVTTTVVEEGGKPEPVGQGSSSGQEPSLGASNAQIARLESRVVAAKRALDAARARASAAHKSLLGIRSPGTVFPDTFVHCLRTRKFRRSDSECKRVAQQAFESARQRRKAASTKYKRASADAKQAFKRYLTLKIDLANLKSKSSH